MSTLLVFHEVDDVDEWLKSPRREQIFGPVGVTARLFRDPEGSNRVGMILDVPDMAAFQEITAVALRPTVSTRPRSRAQQTGRSASSRRPRAWSS